MERTEKKRPIDVLIVAEGTYPFVRGGVSTWIHDLITGLKEFNFGVAFLGSRREDYEGIKYELPENLSYLSTFYLFDKTDRPPPKAFNGKENLLQKVKNLHQWFKKHGTETFPVELRQKDFYLQEVTEEEFLYSKRSWEFISESYMEFAGDVPFIDYFWTIRNVHDPIWRVAKIAQNLRKAFIVHSPSTGYAGFLASLLKHDWKVPFILTEHGIYTKERKIDILSSDWISDRRFFFQKEYGEVDHLRSIWINFFVGMGRVAYESADVIVSLFEDARKVQIELGAPPSKTIVIPNGVKVENYLRARKEKGSISPIIALIGRIVPIKDIKTFIKAMRIVINKIPEAEGWIVGPTDEDPEYYLECKKLVSVLRLENKVKFLGFQKVPDILSKVGLTTLTSISEGMPLVVLESFAAGVPCVTTDVGSCRQLIYGGLNEEDKKLGSAGEVVPVANPGALARAYIKFLTNERAWKSASQVAIRRVERFYSFESFLNNYRELYRRFINGRNSV